MTLLGRVCRGLVLSVASGLIGLVAALGWSGTASAQLLDEIKKRGKIVVATEASYPPFEMVKDGKIVGYGKDILDYCMPKLGVQLEQLDLPYQGIFAGLEAKKYDFVATTVGMWPERQQKYAFTVPIAEGAGAVMKRAGDNRIKKAEDLRGKVVGSQLGSAMEKVAKSYEDGLKAGGQSGYKEFKAFAKAPEAYLALANGQIDAVVQNSTQIQLMMKEKPGVYDLVERIADRVYIGWVTRADAKDVRDFFTNCILEMRDNGRLYAAQDKWFGFRMEIPDKGFRVEGAH